MAHGFADKVQEPETFSPEYRADTSKYIEFVDKVTSKESQNFGDFSTRIKELDEQGADIQRLLTAAIGLSAEAGEFAEIVKKITFQGKPYNADNIEHMKIELGDCLWYVAQACMALGVEFDDLFIRNTNKLMNRYPEGEFSILRSEKRKEGDL